MTGNFSKLNVTGRYGSSAERAALVEEYSETVRELEEIKAYLSEYREAFEAMKKKESLVLRRDRARETLDRHRNAFRGLDEAGDGTVRRPERGRTPGSRSRAPGRGEKNGRKSGGGPGGAKAVRGDECPESGHGQGRGRTCLDTRRVPGECKQPPFSGTGSRPAWKPACLGRPSPGAAGQDGNTPPRENGNRCRPGDTSRPGRGKNTSRPEDTRTWRPTAFPSAFPWGNWMPPRSGSSLRHARPG